MQDYEKSVSFLGTWGPFQRRVFFLLCLASIPTGCILLSVIFLLAIPQHHCYIPTHSNLSQDWVQAIIPVQLLAGQLERSSCSRYELDIVQNLSALGSRPSLDYIQNLSLFGSGPEVLLSSLKQEGCKDGWTYSTEHYQSTVVTEAAKKTKRHYGAEAVKTYRLTIESPTTFNLVCSNQWKQPLTSAVYFLGGLCGCFISGQLSDRFGRKPVLFSAITMLSIFSGAVALASSWPVVIVLFFLLGMGQIASYVILFVLGSEILIGSTRVIYSTLCLPSFYVIGMMMLPGIAYMVTNWRHLSVIMALPCLACVPLWWQIPESPRWLVSHGRLLEAELVLRSAAMENKVEVPRVIFIPAPSEKAACPKSESFSFLDMLRTPTMRHIILSLWLLWLSINITYFGLSFNMSSLYGNPFLNYFLVASVEVPAYAASWLAARSLPRRPSFISFTLLGALALLLIQITLHSNPALTLSLVLLGKFGVLAGASVLYIYTGELSPTVIRSTAMSSCAAFSRVGSCISPYLLQLGVFYQFLPWIIVGALSLLSILICMFLPETFRQVLPDTIQQLALTRSGLMWPWASSPPPKADEKIDQTTATEIICTTHL